LLGVQLTSSMQACLSSDSDTVRSIAKMAVFSLRMSSPLGRNAYFCCTRFNSTLDNITNVNRNTINQCADEQLSTDDNFRVSLIREQLQVRSGALVLTPGGSRVFVLGHSRHDRLVSTPAV
jgi:hypothetical protein